MNRLLCVLVAVSIFSVSAAVMASEKYKPVVVYEVKGDASFETKKILVENLSNALRRSIQRTLASQWSGNGVKNAEQPSRGDLAIYRDLVHAMDKEIKLSMVDINSHNTIDPDESVDLTVEVLWTAKDLGAYPEANILASLGPQYRMIAPLFVASTVLDPALPIDVVSGIFSFEKSKVPGGMQSMYNEGPALYEALKRAAPNKWLPLYTYGNFAFRDKVLKVKSEVNLKPTSIIKRDFPVEPDAEKRVKSIVYEPVAKQRWVTRMSVIREYTSNEILSSYLEVSFGRMSMRDVRSVKFCAAGLGSSSPCLKEINRYPTVTIETNYSGMMGLGAWFLGLKEFQILVKKITIDLKDQRVIPNLSDLPIATENLWGNKTIIDKGTEANPFDLFQLIQRGQLGDQIEGDISERVREAIDAFNNSAIELF